MSETLHFRDKVEEFEQEPRIEAHSQSAEKAEATVEVKTISPAERLQSEAEVAAEATSSDKTLNKIEDAVEETPQMWTPTTISSALKQTTFVQSMKKLRSQETRSERSLSRVIHQPVIRAVSEGAGRTVSRPSGLLGGGLVAFLGSGSYFALARYLHFTYNYSVSLALFAGGFILGLALELFVHFATASQRQVD